MRPSTVPCAVSKAVAIPGGSQHTLIASAALTLGDPSELLQQEEIVVGVGGGIGVEAGIGGVAGGANTRSALERSRPRVRSRRPIRFHRAETGCNRSPSRGRCLRRSGASSAGALNGVEAGQGKDADVMRQRPPRQSRAACPGWCWRRKGCGPSVKRGQGAAFTAGLRAAVMLAHGDHQRVELVQERQAKFRRVVGKCGIH